MARKPTKAVSIDSAKKGGAVTVRLDPKLKYLADLGARKQRRPLSGFIEWAVEQSLSKVTLEEDRNGDTSLMDAERAHSLWDVDEADRVAKLALSYPELLTYEEQLIWKLVRTNGAVWKGNYETGTWHWTTGPQNLVWEKFREHWSVFKAVAEGSQPESSLPYWVNDDEIPF